MYHILRIILYRLWVVSSLTLFSGVVVFWFYGYIAAFLVFTLGISGCHTVILCNRLVCGTLLVMLWRVPRLPEFFAQYGAASGQLRFSLEACGLLFHLHPCRFFTAGCLGFLGQRGILYSAQDLLLYYPNDPPDSRVFVLQPSNYKLPYESIKINSKDGFKIHLFLIKQPVNSNHKPTMLFFHGNAGNMGQRLSNVSGFYHKLNINILMVEYRGYGLSEGSPSEKGLYVDAQSALDYIMQRTDIDVSKIMLFGRSLGGAVAIDLASRLEYRNKIWALVVENTFTSIPDMANVILKWKCLKWLPQFCHKNKFMSLKKMGHVMTPTLVIFGSNDALVPPSMAKELYMRCGAVCKKLALMPGGGHDDTWTCREYYPSVQKFLSIVPPLPDEIGPFFDGDTNSHCIIVHTV